VVTARIGDVVRLMQRGERDESLQRCDDRVVNQNRGRIVQTAVHHAMPNTGKTGHATDMRGKPAMNGSHRALMIVSRNCFVNQFPALRIGDLDAR
jgi:hypothetical protein